MQDSFGEGKQPRKFSWLWSVLIILFVVFVGYYSYQKFNFADNDQTGDSQTSEPVKTAEVWQIDNKIFRKNSTSSDTHKISDNLFRTYYMDSGEIKYADSTDGLHFGSGFSTGIKEQSGKMISNPAVIEISATNWIMIYEMAPIKIKGDSTNQSGPANQRNLYSATSSDGIKFVNSGVAIDSSKEDNYFASVPDLILTPDDQIRMYYVSGGNAIASAISADNGRTWTREPGFRLEDMAVDPDVLYIENKWVMYYSNLDPKNNGIYKAQSLDGLEWNNQTKLFSATTSGAVVDPDVFELSSEKYAMFLGQSETGGSTGGEEINLYYATFSGNIFE